MRGVYLQQEGLGEDRKEQQNFAGREGQGGHAVSSVSPTFRESDWRTESSFYSQWWSECRTCFKTDPVCDIVCSYSWNKEASYWLKASLGQGAKMPLTHSVQKTWILSFLLSPRGEIFLTLRMGLILLMGCLSFIILGKERLYDQKEEYLWRQLILIG